MYGTRLVSAASRMMKLNWSTNPLLKLITTSPLASRFETISAKAGVPRAESRPKRGGKTPSRAAADGT